MGKRIFLSYRRDDSSGHAELLHRSLSQHYGELAVFRDVHAIHPAERFRDAIRAALGETGIVFVVMSRQWADIKDPDGLKRLLNPNDVVCWEIASALQLSIPVLPILVGGAAMPTPSDLPEPIRSLAGIHAYVISEQHWKRDFEALLRLVDDTTDVFVPPDAAVNPFSMRGGITDDEFFHDRDLERRVLRDYLRVRQNCQIVGPRRIGKTSLLRFVQRHAVSWVPEARVAYLDLQDPRCYTLSGWLQRVGDELRLTNTPRTLVELMESVEDLLEGKVRPVLCLDEFGEMAGRPQEFTREAFLTMRACGQRGMSILTAAPRRLSELTDPHDITSPFFNTFPLLMIRAFSAADARAYVDRERPGVPMFAEREKERIIEFSQGHPLALQSACYHVLNGREVREDLLTSLARAREDCDHVIG